MTAPRDSILTRTHTSVQAAMTARTCSAHADTDVSWLKLIKRSDKMEQKQTNFTGPNAQIESSEPDNGITHLCGGVASKWRGCGGGVAPRLEIDVNNRNTSFIRGCWESLLSGSRPKTLI